MPPSFLPPAVVADLKARFPGEKLFAFKSELGAVVLQAPSREAILARFPPPPKPSDARGAAREDDGDLDKDRELVLACAVYPDEPTLKGYLAKLPMLAPFLAAKAKVAAAGIKGEEAGAPSDLGASQLTLLEATGAKAYTLTTDLPAPLDRLVLRAPSADAIRQWEAARAKRSGVEASETFVLACLLHPTQVETNEVFRKRPLLGLYAANRLFAWGLGAVEEADSF
jgi:hypothetical protein